MNENIVGLLQTVRVIDVIMTLVMITTVLGILLTQGKKIRQWLDHWRSKQNFVDNIGEEILALKEKDNIILQEIHTIQDNTVKYREVSKSIRDEMYQRMDADRELIQETNLILKQQIQDYNSTKQEELRNDIEKIYMLHKDSKTITAYQFVVLQGLIKSYEKHGGENSFVHTTVEPAMYTWTVEHLENEIG